MQRPAISLKKINRLYPVRPSSRLKKLLAAYGNLTGTMELTKNQLEAKRKQRLKKNGGKKKKRQVNLKPRLAKWWKNQLNPKAGVKEVNGIGKRLLAN